MCDVCTASVGSQQLIMACGTEEKGVHVLDVGSASAHQLLRAKADGPVCALLACPAPSQLHGCFLFSTGNERVSILDPRSKLVTTYNLVPEHGLSKNPAKSVSSPLLNYWMNDSVFCVYSTCDTVLTACRSLLAGCCCRRAGKTCVFWCMTRAGWAESRSCCWNTTSSTTPSVVVSQSRLPHSLTACLHHICAVLNGCAVATQWAANSEFLVTGCDDTTVRVWDVTRGCDNALVQAYPFVQITHRACLCCAGETDQTGALGLRVRAVRLS